MRCNGAPGELPALPELRAAAGAALVEVSTEEVADDWHERWREFHTRVVAVPGRVRSASRPRAVAPAARDPTVVDVVVDPGQAFGTGAHDTTRLCWSSCWSSSRAVRSSTWLRLGGPGHRRCPARLGPVTAVDHERESVRATRANAAANGVRLTAVRHDLVRDGPGPSARMVVANLLGAAPAPGRPRRAPGAERPRTLIAGGLLRAEAGDVGRALAAGFGLREAQRRHAGEWAALLLTEDESVLCPELWPQGRGQSLGLVLPERRRSDFCGARVLGSGAVWARSTNGKSRRYWSMVRSAGGPSSG
jgi:ribosomal protein L11 methyltransferase